MSCKSNCHCHRRRRCHRRFKLCKSFRKRAKKTFVAGANCCSDFRNIFTC